MVMVGNIIAPMGPGASRKYSGRYYPICLCGMDIFQETYKKGVLMKRHTLHIFECTKDQLMRHLKRTKSPLKVVPYGVYDIAHKEIWVQNDLKDAFTTVLLHEFVHFLQCNFLPEAALSRKEMEKWAHVVSDSYRKVFESYRRKYHV